MLLQSYELGGEMVDVYQVDRKLLGTIVRQTISVYRETFIPISEASVEGFSGGNTCLFSY